MLLYVGGCAYRSMVHVTHATSLAALVANLAVREMPSPLIGYAHTSDLYAGRMKWLRRAIASAAQWAVSIDSDTEFDPRPLLADLALHQDTPDVAIIGAPVRVGGTQHTYNVELERGTRADRDAIGDVLDAGVHASGVAAVGFGLVAFRLDWYRKHWPEPAPENITIKHGEDIGHCYSVVDRRGRILLSPVPVAHHEHRP